jgi:hypothetical protein
MELSQTFFDCSNLGENTVMLTVIDTSGNQSVCLATVTVVDNRDPTIACPADTVRSANSGCAWVPEDGGGASMLADDNCPEGLKVTNNAPSSFRSARRRQTRPATQCRARRL